MRLFIVLLFLLPGLAQANDWDVAKQPGVIAIMRHALAPGTGDPSRFALGDCSTQRNLDARGRSQARAIGAAFRDRGISFDRVLTSQWCRTTETAQLLGVGDVEPVAALNSFFSNRETSAEQTAAVRDLLAQTEGRLMLVTHQVNISALTGAPTRSGEVLLITAQQDTIEIVGSILIAP